MIAGELGLGRYEDKLSLELVGLVPKRRASSARHQRLLSDDRASGREDPSRSHAHRCRPQPRRHQSRRAAERRQPPRPSGRRPVLPPGPSQPRSDSEQVAAGMADGEGTGRGVVRATHWQAHSDRVCDPAARREDSIARSSSSPSGSSESHRSTIPRCSTSPRAGRSRHRIPTASRGFATTAA